MKSFLRLLAAFGLLLLATPTWATVYWASHTGSNTVACTDIDSVGTADSPGTDPGVYGTIGQAARCAAVAGDVVNIKATGVYTGANNKIDSAGNGTIPLVTQFVSGTSETVRTIVQGDPSGARPVIQVASFYCTYATAAAQRNYQTIRHLALDGNNLSACSGHNVVAGHHITIEDSEIYNSYNVAVYVGGYNSGEGSGPSISPFFIMRNNKIHDTGFDGQGYAFYITQHDALVEGNEIYNTKGQGGQFTSDVWQVDRGVLRRNYFHDLKRGTQAGYSGQCNGVSFEGVGSEAYDNIFDLRNCEATSTPGGYALEVGYHVGATLKAYHNLFLTASTFTHHGIHVRSTPTGAQDFKNNVFLVPNGNAVNHPVGTATITKTFNACVVTQNCSTANGTTITAITDIVVSSSNFLHKVGSLGIDAGTPSPYRSCVDACDLGPFEVPKFGSASIDLNVMDMTIRSSRLPLLPSASVTGLSAGCTGTDCGTPVVASAARQVGSDTIFRLTLSGIGGSGNCAVAQTWVANASSSNITDGMWVGPPTSSFSTGFVQGLHNFSNQPVTEVCSGSSTPPPTGGLLIHYKVDENTGTNLNDETVNNLDGTAGGAYQWVTGFTGSGIHLDAGTVANRIAVPHGNAVNLSTQSLSACEWVLPDTANVSTNRVVLGTTFVSSQRFHVGWAGSKWQIGIQSSGLSGSGTSEFPVSASWTRVCVVANSATDVATLYINGVKGTSSGTTKSYTSYALPSNISVGCPDSIAATDCGGFIVDEPKVWNVALTDQEVLDDYRSYVPQQAPPAVGVISVVAHRWQRPYMLGGVIQDIGGNNATASVVQNGSIAVVFQLDCTGGACPSMNPRLRNNKAGGSFTLGVPDAIGPDGILFFGTQVGDQLNTGTTTGRLTGALTEVNGPTVLSATADPSITMAQDSSFMLRYIVSVGPGAVAQDVFCLKIYDQNGNPLNSYVPVGGACFTVTGPTGGFASLSDQPTGLTVTPNPMVRQRPSPGWLVGVR